MNTITIKTNNHYRHIMYGFELTEKEKKEFDYYNEEEIDEAMFFRYKKRIYDIGEFLITDKFHGFDGYGYNDFCGGLLIKISKCGEGVKIGRYF